MGLETGDYIDDLNPAWPVGGTDDVNEGDDHLRLIKKVVQQALPGNTAAGVFAVNINISGYDLTCRHVTGSGTVQGATVNATGDLVVGGASSMVGALTVPDINKTPQVAIAGGRYDGSDGSALGANHGITNLTRTAAGTYQVQLAESFTRLDLGVAGDIGYALLGAGAYGLADSPNGAGWIQLTTFPLRVPEDPADPVEFGFVIFNNGRT